MAFRGRSTPSISRVWRKSAECAPSCSKITTSPRRRLLTSFAKMCRESRYSAESRWILPSGGVNPSAVEWMTKVRGGYGRVIWLPTFDSEAQVKRAGQQRPFAPVVRDGKVVPEVAQVIAIAARSHLVLDTGHAPGSDAVVIIREASRQVM